REYDAEIVAADTRRDLAVLKVADDGPLPTIPLGRSDDLMVGETVIAIGNPLGFKHTVTAGVVSAVGRDLEISRDVAFNGLIQTDASINPGNSGGPLLNVLGDLIGINTAIRGDAQNIGFAIPVDQLRDVLPDMLDVERRYGVVSGLEVDHLAVPRVIGVLGDSAADAAGVRPGDVIVGVDGKPIREGIDFDIALIKRRPGETVRLEIDRGGERFDTALRLRPRPAPDGGALALERLGLELYPLPERVAQELGLPPGRGLLVTDVEPRGPASEAGILPRDVLIAMGRHYVSSLTALGQRLEIVRPGDVVPIRVLRVERSRKLQLEGPIRVR
ncbi:MAG: trypsin-like peptidase domain-containing protein, partial [Phycisphaerae bacterium]|nr:trypsin-like peptidase domain-containing protein [Phycisphaerae bacterium]